MGAELVKFPVRHLGYTALRPRLAMNSFDDACSSFDVQSTSACVAQKSSHENRSVKAKLGGGAILDHTK
eukprot:CAMPEP_0194035460 /NCGR_PEP_ID=MMETSP0009_2-20130614/7886_1 /TAXON_ID=210454 /ORGANISM="Grammatophora oceanica, Strain CCMP 410" /LENGTH=68 /DNA_ID=CAMNT_0038676817 /DNA_START=24 /DNA_END=227 /DNA_ORIENTATION=+